MSQAQEAFQLFKTPGLVKGKILLSNEEEVVDPKVVPKVTLPSGEKVPCMGMGTFGSDRVSAEEVSEAVAGAIAADIVCLTVQHAMEMSIRLVKFSRQLLMKG